MNHFYYKKLNMYFPIQYKNNIERHIDEILILANLQGYKFTIGEASTIAILASITIRNNDSDYVLLFGFNYYDNEEKTFKFDRMDVYHKKHSKSEIILDNLSFLKKLEKIKELI